MPRHASPLEPVARRWRFISLPLRRPLRARGPAVLRWALVVACWASWVPSTSDAAPASPAFWDESSCSTLPPGAENPAVVACETKTHYTFDVVGLRASYDKESYREGLSALIGAKLTGEGLDASAWQGAQIDIFLAMPEADPHSTRARALVFSADGPAFVVFMPWRMEEWSVETIQLGVLDDVLYPKSFGFAPRTLLIKARPNVDLPSLLASLARHDIHEIESLGSSWYRGQTRLFQEKWSRARLGADDGARREIVAVELSALFEWIAHRTRIFGFTWAS